MTPLVEKRESLEICWGSDYYTIVHFRNPVYDIKPFKVFENALIEQAEKAECFFGFVVIEPDHDIDLIKKLISKYRKLFFLNKNKK